MKSDLCDIDVWIVAESAAAFKVHTGDATKAVWVPKSQVEIDERGPDRFATITLPEWLAIEKGIA